MARSHYGTIVPPSQCSPVSQNFMTNVIASQEAETARQKYRPVPHEVFQSMFLSTGELEWDHCELYLGNGTMPHSTGPLNGFYCMIYQSANPHKLISITQSVSGNRKLIRIRKILEITPVKSAQSAEQSRGLSI